MNEYTEEVRSIAKRSINDKNTRARGEQGKTKWYYSSITQLELYPFIFSIY
jgi:hypothetical protein